MRSIFLRVSDNADGINFKTFRGVKVLLTILSAFSLLSIPLWEGIQMNDISLLEIDISSWIRRTYSLQELGFTVDFMALNESPLTVEGSAFEAVAIKSF